MATKAQPKQRNLVTKPHAYLVGASMYGGPTDRSTPGDTGASGKHLTGKMAFAELGMGTMLGHLPMGTKLKITYKGKEVIAEKLDIGLGGAPVQGHARRIDLWWQLAQALGFTGTGLVTIQRPDGITIHGPGQETTKGTAAEIHVPNTAEQILGAAEETAEKVAAPALAVPEFLAKIADPENLLDAGKIVIGSIMIVLGLLQLGKVAFSTGGAGAAVSGIADLTPVGATAKAVKKTAGIENAKTQGHTARTEATTASKVKIAQKAEAAKRATLRAEKG